MSLVLNNEALVFTVKGEIIQISAGIKLEGDKGNLQDQISPYFELKEMFINIEYKGKEEQDGEKFLPFIWKTYTYFRYLFQSHFKPKTIKLGSSWTLNNTCTDLARG